MDHHVILPERHSMIRVVPDEKEVTVTFGTKRWIFPREDCMILPVVNTTAEEIAEYVATELHKMLRPQIGDRLQWLEVGIDENHGQWGTCRIPW